MQIYDAENHTQKHPGRQPAWPIWPRFPFCLTTACLLFFFLIIFFTISNESSFPLAAVPRACRPRAVAGCCSLIPPSEQLRASYLSWILRCPPSTTRLSGPAGLQPSTRLGREMTSQPLVFIFVPLVSLSHSLSASLIASISSGSQQECLKHH